MSYLNPSYHTKIILEYLVNDAFSLLIGKHKILVDSFFSRRFLPFSAVPADQLREMQ